MADGHGARPHLGPAVVDLGEHEHAVAPLRVGRGRGDAEGVVLDRPEIGEADPHVAAIVVLHSLLKRHTRQVTRQRLACLCWIYPLHECMVAQVTDGWKLWKEEVPEENVEAYTEI